jgi:hypothetical protein
VLSGWILFGNDMFSVVIMLKVIFWNMIILFDDPSDIKYLFIGILIGMLMGIDIVLGMVVLCMVVFSFSAKAKSTDNVERMTASITPIGIKLFNTSPPIF